MRRGGGKQKGSGFERLVCKALSLWITQGRHDDRFWRSALSGGRASVQFKKGKKNRTQVGDITAIHPDGHILTDKVVIECKHVRDLNLTAAILSQRGLLYLFWLELCKQARQVRRQPMLIARQNKQPTFILISAEGADAIDIDYECWASFPEWPFQPMVFPFAPIEKMGEA